MVLHASGNSFDISSMLICFLTNITVHTCRKLHSTVFVYCCSLHSHRNPCAVNYTTLIFLHQNNQLLLVREKRCLVSYWPAAFQFEILLTTFLDLRVVAGRSRTWAGRSKTVWRRPMLTFWRRTFFQILAHPVFKM